MPVLEQLHRKRSKFVIPPSKDKAGGKYDRAGHDLLNQLLRRVSPRSRILMYNDDYRQNQTHEREDCNTAFFTYFHASKIPSSLFQAVKSAPFCISVREDQLHSLRNRPFYPHCGIIIKDAALVSGVIEIRTLIAEFSII